MDQELVPLSEGKTRLHELVRDLAERDVVLVRYGRPVAVLLGFDRYRQLLAGRGTESAVRTGPMGLGPKEADRLAEICRSRRVRRLVLFGSAARGEVGPASDADLLVVFDPMPPRERADALFGLQEDLEALLGRPVDLIEDEAVTNPFLRRSIERAQVVLFEAA
jgi:hypothetical protein